MKCDNGLDKLTGKKILLAGGTGFIGSRVVNFLESCGVQVVVLTRRDMADTLNTRYWNVDLSDYEKLKERSKQEEFYAAVYMAANIPLAGSKKETYYEAKCSTLDPFVNFCECFANKVSKMLYISSVDVLGACKEVGFRENVSPHVATPYGLAKYCGEFYVRNICEKFGIDYIIYRFAQVFGPNEPAVRIIPILKNALINDKEFMLYTDGTERRRFLYVEDAVQAVVRGLLSHKKGIYNIAGEEIITIHDLIILMEEIWDKKLKLSICNQMVGVDNVPCIEKANLELGFKPCYSIRQGLEEIKEKEKNE